MVEKCIDPRGSKTIVFGYRVDRNFLWIDQISLRINEIHRFFGSRCSIDRDRFRTDRSGTDHRFSFWDDPLPNL